ncbi:acetyl-CoA carboxylase biotin carboxyl carrier protein subunit [Lujinxingia vulgaris]|nr:biotin/lipoyl-containing protein [Lujinxingia vulgaris]
MAQYVVELDGGRERLVQIREATRGQWVATVESPVEEWGERKEVAVQLVGRQEGGRVVVRVNGVEHTLGVGTVAGATGEVRVQGTAASAAGGEARRATVRSAGEVVLSRSARDCSKAPAAAVSAEDVQRSPMTGVVLSVEVAAGERVECGQALAVIEAMKMENTLYATHAGVIGEVCVGPGETVRKDDVLMRWDAGESNQNEEL